MNDNPKTDLYALATALGNRGLDVDNREHPFAAEMREAKAAVPGLSADFASSISPRQLHVAGAHGRISVVRGGASFGDYEIYCLEGDLFEDIRRYETVKEAADAIHEALTTGKLTDEDE